MGHHHLLLKGNYMLRPLIGFLDNQISKQFNAGSVDSSLINNIDIAPDFKPGSNSTSKSIYVGT